MQQVWSRGDFSNLSNFVAKQYHVSEDEYDPWSNQVIDHEVFKQRVLYSRNAFPDVNLDTIQMTGDDSCIAIRWIMSGTHKDDLPMLAATGKTYSVAGMTFYNFNNGRLSGHDQCFNQFSFIKQLGLMVSPLWASLTNLIAKIVESHSCLVKVVADSEGFSRLYPHRATRNYYDC